MKDTESAPIATAIALHRRQRVLEVGFDDGTTYHLPCEFLRVYSPSAEVKVAREQGQEPVGKENVNITGILPVGTYAVRLEFDDGHHSGIYSWATLHDLGRRQETLWREYLERLGQSGVGRGAGEQPRSGDKQVEVLYFATLAGKLALERETLILPAEVDGVDGLLRRLRQRGGDWERLLTEAQLRIMVNKAIVPASAAIHDGDEVALVPDKIQ